MIKLVLLYVRFLKILHMDFIFWFCVAITWALVFYLCNLEYCYLEKKSFYKLLALITEPSVNGFVNRCEFMNNKKCFSRCFVLFFKFAGLILNIYIIIIWCVIKNAFNLDYVLFLLKFQIEQLIYTYWVTLSIWQSLGIKKSIL